MKTLNFITSNKGKYQEASQKLKPAGYHVIQKNIGYPEIQAETLEEVVRFGSTFVQHRFPHCFFIEDAGLYIDTLHGFPGVYSKYVYYTIGCSGILKLLEGTKSSQRTATFRSVYALGEPKKDPMLFIGECTGIIAECCMGAHGFGYDPIFIPDGDHRTFAQMSVDDKNRYSHRGRALEKVIHYLKQQK